ncbi:MAG TPA: hypothetical protein VI521_02650, partial [Candidatus Babeliales bacterium]|nr:hypothetical protein [Candidatus Babeliales bacterium]
MRIKSIFALLFFTSALCAVESQLSTQFQNRFGPNSPIYNEPLYFSYGKKSKKSTRKKRTYRE